MTVCFPCPTGLGSFGGKRWTFWRKSISIPAAAPLPARKYYFPGDQAGKKYAAAISAAVSAALGLPDRGAKASDYYGVIRQTGPTACLVETCFISSSDLDKVKDAAGQALAGRAIADGIAKAAGLSARDGFQKINEKLYFYRDGKPIITDKDGVIQ